MNDKTQEIKNLILKIQEIKNSDYFNLFMLQNAFKTATQSKQIDKTNENNDNNSNENNNLIYVIDFIFSLLSGTIAEQQQQEQAPTYLYIGAIIVSQNGVFTAQKNINIQKMNKIIDQIDKIILKKAIKINKIIEKSKSKNKIKNQNDDNDDNNDEIESLAARGFQF